MYFARRSRLQRERKLDNACDRGSRSRFLSYGYKKRLPAPAGFRGGGACFRLTSARMRAFLYSLPATG